MKVLVNMLIEVGLFILGGLIAFKFIDSPIHAGIAFGAFCYVLGALSMYLNMKYTFDKAIKDIKQDIHKFCEDMRKEIQ